MSAYVPVSMALQPFLRCDQTIVLFPCPPTIASPILALVNDYTYTNEHTVLQFERLRSHHNLARVLPGDSMLQFVAVCFLLGRKVLWKRIA